MKKQMLYLFRECNSDSFKIGVSTDVAARAQSLPQNIDLARSFYVECGGVSAGRIEKVLHNLFTVSRLTRVIGEGRTEWFSGGCLEAVCKFLADQQEHLQCSSVKSCQSLPRSPKPLARSPREVLPVFPLMGGRFFLRRKPPTEEELEEFWAASRDHDAEITPIIRGLTAEMSSISWLGRVECLSELRVCVAFDSSGYELVKRLQRFAPLFFCYEDSGDNLRGICERNFSPLSAFAYRSKPDLGVCELEVVPDKGASQLSAMAEWNAVLQSLPPADSSTVEKLQQTFGQDSTEWFSLKLSDFTDAE